jgi:uncharacterized protein
MELWTALMLGLAGSLHCAGMCGPLVIAMPVTGASWGMHLAGRLSYNSGRILTYGILGIIFGFLGKLLGLAGLQRWLSIIIGVAILLSLIAWSSRKATLALSGPVTWLKSGLGKLLQQRSLGSHLLLGGLNGLLPCGLVYVACAGAISTGDSLKGLQYMLLFGLGTVPMMLALGMAGRLLHVQLRLRFQKLIPVCLVIMALLLILRGMALGIPYVSPVLSDHPQPGACCHPGQ